MKSEYSKHFEQSLRCAFCQAGEKEERDAVRSILNLVVEEDATQRNQAERFYSLISDKSQLHPVAAQAMSLVHIRQGRYTDALSCLNESTEQAANATGSLAPGRDRLKLWLLLEEGSTKSDSQYKQLVAQTLKKELPEAERIESCEFIGRIMGMLDSDQSGSKIEPTKLEKGLTAIQKLKSLAAVAKFDTGRKDARDWGVQLESRVKELKALGASQAEEMDRSIQADLAKAIEALPLTYGPMQNEKSSALKKCRAFLPHS